MRDCEPGGRYVAVCARSHWHVLDAVAAICDPLLPGLLMGAVRLPDNLAKETLHINKHKQRQADPGNNRGRRGGGEDGEANKKTRTNRQALTHMCVFKQNKK